MKALGQCPPWCEEPSLPLLSVTASALATPSARWGLEVGLSISSAPLLSHPAVLRSILALRNHAAQLAIVLQMSRQESRSSAALMKTVKCLFLCLKLCT